MYHRVAHGSNIARWLYAYNLKDAYDLYAKEITRVSKILMKKGEYQMEFALFSEKELLHSTDDYSKDIVQTMVGRAIEMRAL